MLSSVPEVSDGVIVDRVKCQGTGYCVKIAPHLFKLDGPGPVEFDRDLVKDADVDLLHEAEDACPTRAISVVE